MQGLQVLGCLIADECPFVRPGVYDFERFVPMEIAGETAEMPDFVIDPGDYTIRGDVDFPPGGPPPDPTAFIRGDANADGCVSLSDAIMLFWKSAGRELCPDAADVDDDGEFSIDDGDGVGRCPHRTAVSRCGDRRQAGLPAEVHRPAEAGRPHG
jgi:hypothetical protein